MFKNVGEEHRGRLRKTDFGKKTPIRRRGGKLERIVFENDEGSERVQNET